MKNMKKILVLSLAAVLLVAVSIVGTYAYLTDVSGEVTNTFAPSNINVELAESTGNSYKFIPGVNITKDPTVTVTTDIDAYVFVKIEEDENWPEVATYSASTAWTALGDNYPGVYYTTVSGQTEPHNIGVLANNTITVPATMDADDMPEGNVTLKFTAYACQQGGFANAAAAWAELNPTTGE